MANAEPVGHVASPELAERVRHLVASSGYTGACRTLGGMSRSVIASIAGRLPVRASSLIAADLLAPKLPTTEAT